MNKGDPYVSDDSLSCCSPSHRPHGQIGGTAPNNVSCETGGDWSSSSSSTSSRSTHVDVNVDSTDSKSLPPSDLAPTPSPSMQEGERFRGDEGTETEPNGSTHNNQSKDPKGELKQEEKATCDKIKTPPAIDAIEEDWRAKGRRGDPRMHRAVTARLAKPDLTLLQALLIGGFKFPDLKDGVKKHARPQSPIYDTDNILLSQRKNQLSRRLRLHARKVIAKERKHVGLGAVNINDLNRDAALKTILISNTYNFPQQNGGYQSPCNTSQLIEQQQSQHHNLLLNSQYPGAYQTIYPPSGTAFGLMQMEQQQQQQNIYLNNAYMQQQQQELALRSLVDLAAQPSLPLSSGFNLIDTNNLMTSSIPQHPLSKLPKAAYDQLQLQKALLIHQQAEIDKLRSKQA